MWGWLKALASGFGEVALDFLKSWWDEEKKIQNEFKARSLEGKIDSMRESNAIVEKIREEQKKVKPISVSEWNKGALILLFCFFLVGCSRTVFVDREMPIIEEPPRPVLSDTDTNANVDLLMEYALKLEVAIKTYNEEARRINKD